jgi:23S rRNA (guanosine2251-2'-O)-methyltransferase
MYNDRMTDKAFEMRICKSCGLRYPLVMGQQFGTRCPACMGQTRLAHRRHRRDLTMETRPPSSQVFHQQDSGMAVLLDNIRSAWNTGSILRSADGFGFNQVYMCGITPTPYNESVTKTSLGAEDSVPWSYHKDAVKLVKGLRKTGRGIYALEEHQRAIEIDQLIEPLKDSILIVGNEITGVDPELMEYCDKVLYIPMRGEKRSFNVAIAFSIAAFAVSRK